MEDWHLLPIDELTDDDRQVYAKHRTDFTNTGEPAGKVVMLSVEDYEQLRSALAACQERATDARNDARAFAAAHEAAETDVRRLREAIEKAAPTMLGISQNSYVAEVLPDVARWSRRSYDILEAALAEQLAAHTGREYA